VWRQGYKKEVDQWMEKKGIQKVAEAARSLGVGESTLKSIRSNKGRLRCSQETLAAVLKKIGALNP
jgi:hypothetical protein